MTPADIVATIVGGLAILSYILSFANTLKDKGSDSRNLTDRVSTLENKTNDVASDIKTIKENHLAHIQADISSIQINLQGINTTLEFLKAK